MFPLLLKVTEKNRAYFGIANAGAGGVFLGAGLLHMLPDSFESFDQLDLGSYPWPMLLCGIGFFITLIIELFLSPGHEAIIEVGGHKHNKKDHSSPKPLLQKAHSHQQTHHSDDERQYGQKGPRSHGHSPLNGSLPFQRLKRSGGGTTPLRRQQQQDLRRPLVQQSSKGPVLNFEVPEPDVSVLRDASPGPFTRMAALNPESSPGSTTLRHRKYVPSTSGHSTGDLQMRTVGHPRKPGHIPDSPCHALDVRINYYSRLFETGFATALRIQEEALGPMDNIPKLVVQPDDDATSASKLTALILLLVLSLHSFITGLAVGSSGVDSSVSESQETKNYAILLFGLTVHKAVAAMSLGIQVKKAEWSRRKSAFMIFLFSISTPLGILIGLVLADSLAPRRRQIFTAFAMSLGSGSFIYLAVMENIVEEFVESQSNRKTKLFFCVAGFALMGGLAVIS